jgi:hypothetical protein
VRLTPPSGRNILWTGTVNYLIMVEIFVMVLSPKGYPSPQDSLKTGYKRGLNIDSWQGGFVYRKALSSPYTLNISEILSSSRLQVSPTQDKWKDQHHLIVDFSRIFTRRFSLNLMGSSFLFSDKQSGYVNDIRTHLIGLGATYSGKKFRIPTLLGVKEDHRFGQKDRGPSYRMGVELPQFDIGEYSNQFHTTYEEDNLRRRKNNRFSLSYLVFREFYTETSDSLRLALHRQRRDYYISSSGEIESREEKIQEAENTLTYRIRSDFHCRIRGGVVSRLLRIDLLNESDKALKRERKDFNTVGNIDFRLKIPSFWIDMSFSYVNEEQKYRLAETLPSSPYSGSHYLVTPDNRSAYTTISLRTGWRFFSTDSVVLTSTLQRYRYDTPDPKNFDDRDELRFKLSCQEFHAFSPTLTLRLLLSLNFLHFVYIYGEKSADNNWTRILRFNPTVSWTPTPRWKFSQSVEVLANYVDYDYESLFPSTRSFLYRKFRLDDSTQVHITSRLSLSLHYRLELDENGKFLWDRWLEQKLIDRQSHTLALSLYYRPWKAFRISPGYSFFSRRGYYHTTNHPSSQDRELNLDHRSAGPYLGLSYQSNRLRFTLRGNTIVTKTLNIKKQVLTRIDLNMSWAL